LNYPIPKSIPAEDLRRSIDSNTLAQRWFVVKITANSRRCAALATKRVMDMGNAHLRLLQHRKREVQRRARHDKVPSNNLFVAMLQVSAR
jgi:hypothetical protein